MRCPLTISLPAPPPRHTHKIQLIRQTPKVPFKQSVKFPLWLTEPKVCWINPQAKMNANDFSITQCTLHAYEIMILESNYSYRQWMSTKWIIYVMCRSANTKIKIFKRLNCGHSSRNFWLYNLNAARSSAFIIVTKTQHRFTGFLLPVSVQTKTSKRLLHIAEWWVLWFFRASSISTLVQLQVVSQLASLPSSDYYP